MEKKKFKSYLKDSTYLPSNEIIKAVDENNFPFMKNKFFSCNPSYLAADEFNRCVELFKERIANNKASANVPSVTAKIIINEEKHLKELENLCNKSVIEMYDVPGYIKLESKIKMTDDFDTTANDTDKQFEKKLSPDKMKALKQEIEKRRILNSIVHGGAIHQWTSSFFIIQEELNNINPELIPLYKEYSSIVNYQNWKHSLATTLNANSSGSFGIKSLVVQGYNKVNYKDKKIESVGMILPVTLHETSKGVLDYLIAAGIPNHLSKEELSFVLKKADKYEHEFWHYYMGPTLWRAILTTANVESTQLPKIISAMSKMEYNELADFCIAITYDTENTGMTEMNKLKKSLKI